MTSPRKTYTFGPLERRGVLGPFRAGQAGVLALAAVAAIAALDVAPNATGAVLGVLAFAAGVAVAVIPVGSRTVEEWAPLACGFATRRARRQTETTSPLPTGGLRVQLRRRSAEVVARPAPIPPPTV